MDEDKDKSAFTSHIGTYRFKQMLFSLMNASASFDITLNMILTPYIRQWRLVYSDGIIVFSKDIEPKIDYVEKILSDLSYTETSLKLKKRDFWKKPTKSLEHMISSVKLSINDSKTKALKELQNPTAPFEVRAFLEICNAYHSFESTIARNTHPLTQLFTNRKPFQL